MGSGRGRRIGIIIKSLSFMEDLIGRCGRTVIDEDRWLNLEVKVGVWDELGQWMINDGNGDKW